MSPSPSQHDAWALARGEWLPTAVRSISVEIPGGVDAAVRARRRVLAAIGDVLGEVERCDFELLLSELVTNAVRHGGMRGPDDVIAVRAAVAPGRLRLEVCDGGGGFTAARRPAPRALEEGGGGLGLVLLDRLAASWGVAVEGGTCVWAELDRVREREQVA